MDKGKFITLLSLAAMFALILSANTAESSSSPFSSSGSTSSSASSKASTATQARQSPLSTAATMIGALGSLVPGLVTNIAPLVILFGLGAMMMPSLGLSAMGLLRESRRSANDQNQIPNVQLPLGPFAQYAARPLQTSPQDIYYFTKRSFPSLMSSFNTGQLVAGFQDLLERVATAIDNADKRYN